MAKVVTVGLDLGKNVFHVHGDKFWVGVDFRAAARAGRPPHG